MLASKKMSISSVHVHFGIIRQVNESAFGAMLETFSHIPARKRFHCVPAYFRNFNSIVLKNFNILQAIVVLADTACAFCRRKMMCVRWRMSPIEWAYKFVCMSYSLHMFECFLRSVFENVELNLLTISYTQTRFTWRESHSKKRFIDSYVGSNSNYSPVVIRDPTLGIMPNRPILIKPNRPILIKPN